MSYWLAEVVSYPVETGGIWYNNAAQRAPGVRLAGWHLARRWGPHVPSDRQATTHKPIAEGHRRVILNAGLRRLTFEQGQLLIKLSGVRIPARSWNESEVVYKYCFFFLLKMIDRSQKNVYIIF